MTVKLQINELQPLDPRQMREQLLHVLQNHPAGAVDVHLVVLPGKVAGKCVAEALDIDELAVGLAVFGDHSLEGADVV